MPEKSLPGPVTDLKSAPADLRGRMTDWQLKEQLNEYLARHGRDIDGLVTDLIRRLHDEAEVSHFCRIVSTSLGANVLQVVLTHAVKRIGQEGYRRPKKFGGWPPPRDDGHPL